MEVRAVGSNQWRELRSLRLRALADAPTAFASTLAEEKDKPDEFWQERATGGDATTTLFAVEDESPIGTATVLIEGGEPRRAHMVGMWVEPSHRRRGAGGSLIEAAASWARAAGAGQLDLWVTERNEAAVALYTRAGFRLTPQRQPLPSNPSLTEVVIRKTL